MMATAAGIMWRKVRQRTDWSGLSCSYGSADALTESRMYIGGGLLGTVLVVLLVVYLMRRV